MGFMNNWARQCFAGREPEREERGVFSRADVSLLFGLSAASDVLLTPALSCSGVVNLMHIEQSKHPREKERERGVDYITLLLCGRFSSSALNSSPFHISLSLSSGWAAAAAGLWIGRLSHRPGLAAPLLPLPPALFLLAPPSCPPSPPSLPNPPCSFSSSSSSSSSPLLSAVDALLTYSMDSGGEGEEGWMEDQWEKW